MRTRISPWGLLALALGTACGSAQKPVTFVTSATVESGIDIVSRTLAAEGHSATSVDRQTGIVLTEWQDTGFGYGFVNQQPANIVRRYVVILAPSGNGANVTVRIDTKRCAQGWSTMAGVDRQGPWIVNLPGAYCQESPMIPGSFQEDIDALAGKIQHALAATAPKTI
ncbi:hypothetical protein LVJ94_39315 [Pendulispora rubella]|uniref:Lipoprotein n=1 Tax=Pendulispora rubella TaxID=2741070 RepID=A0ABZ2KWK7_9BACT